MKKILTILLAVFLMLELCACSSNKTATSTSPIVAEAFDDIKGPISLVIIVGRHANAGKPTNDMLRKAKGLILKSFTPPKKESSDWRSTANISIIISDGFPVPTKKSLDDLLCISVPYEQNVKDDIESYSEKITQLLVSDGLKADNEEVDLIAALGQARVYLNSNSSDSKKYILILDTGVTTTGYFNMNKVNVLDGTAEYVANKLPSAQLPSLDGITVMFNGVGNLPNDPTNGQTKLLSKNQEAKNALKNVWKEVLKNKCHATLYKDDIVEASPGEDQPYLSNGEGYPYVTTVAFIPSEQNSETPHEIDEVFGASTFFKGNSTEFVNDAYAEASLKDIAIEIRKFLNAAGNEDKKIYVVGSIAMTEKDVRPKEDKYSKGRAVKVSEKIINMLKDSINPNILRERIIPIDAGATILTGWRDADEFKGGSWNEVEAEKNRVVAIISSNSQKAQVDGLKSYIP